jgi:D-apionolactonase
MPEDTQIIYGTRDGIPPARTVTLGPMSMTIVAGDLVGVSCHGVEVLRRLAYPVRDADWGTMAVETVSEAFDAGPVAFSYDRTFVVDGGALQGRLIVEASVADTVQLVARLMLRSQTDVTVNRAGFVVLHPILGVVGQPLQVTHSDGSRRDTRFPNDISPGQPVFDISGLSHVVRGIRVELAFGGDVFEMEDQRNWSDASFKTYCRPLARPWPYSLKAGEEISQEIALTLSGMPAPPDAQIDLDQMVTCPEIALAMDAGDRVGLHGLPITLRCGPDVSGENLTAHAGRDVTLEIVLPKGSDPRADLQRIARTCASMGVHPRHVVGLPAAYLASHQPEGPWPEGPAPRDLIPLVRAAFPDAKAGTGVLTNFTELNRCPPDAAAADFVTFSTTAIVHAADDLSVLQTLEALPHILQSAKALAAGRPLRLGLVSVGMRSNPYGRDVAPNPTLARIAMAKDDPRQRGLFAAAWTVGALTAIAGDTVESLCLGMSQGPLALGSGDALYPVYHVVRVAAEMAGQAARKVDADGLTGLVTAKGRGIVANLGDQAQAVPSGTTHVLSADTFAEAGADPGWLHKPGQVPDRLPPFGIAFLQGTA